MCNKCFFYISIFGNFALLSEGNLSGESKEDAYVNGDVDKDRNNDITVFMIEPMNEYRKIFCDQNIVRHIHMHDRILSS